MQHLEHRRRGMALLYAVFAAFTAATLVSVLLSTSLSSTRLSTVKNFGGRAEYLAQGAVEAAKTVVRAEIAAWRTPPATGTVSIDGTPVSYTITQISPDGAASNIKLWDPADPPVIRTDPSGIQTLVTSYRIDASATVQNHSATAHRLVHAEATPVFQYAVFYDSDLEINPGPSMTLTGRVHTNSDLYMGCGAGNTLRLNSNFVHAAGDVLRHRKDAPATSSGTVTIRNWVSNPFDLSEPTSYFVMNSASQMGGVPCNGGYDSEFTTGWDGNDDGDFTDPGDWLPWGPGALDYWSEPAGYAGGTGSTLKDFTHGVTAATPPPLESIQMFEPQAGGDWSNVGGNWISTPGAGTHDKGFFHSQAGLSIVANASHTGWTAYDVDHQDVSAFIPAGTVSMSSIYDARQAGGTSGVSTKVKTMKVDMSLLKTSAKWPANGLLFVGCNNKGTGVNAKGVELTNGGTLPAKLTVVSDGALYVKGDYNTTAKKGCAVIADSVNLLSNAWNNSKTKTSGVPVATPTVYNAAIITGNTNTVAGSTYSGGFENLPRFHENWAGVNCTIRGSFVNFWFSKFATGRWEHATYTPPNRLWGYDPFFNTIANLPPFTPMIVVTVDVVCW